MLIAQTNSPRNLEPGSRFSLIVQVVEILSRLSTIRDYADLSCVVKDCIVEKLVLEQIKIIEMNKASNSTFIVIKQSIIHRSNFFETKGKVENGG